MGFNHPYASTAWEAKELTPDGIKNVLVVETYLVLTADAEGHDLLAVSNLLAAAKEYLVQHGKQLECVRLFEIKEIG
ncbi:MULTISPECIES: hypothetical protein [unclassified Bradyrhizobium]|uniref:hypothetical protein n=1 Tax=unclassified Bradyrhizobium TaxID=2631580 RepID=UPI001FFAAB81|nr:MULTISPECIES: hypothetical protein [unclassified Bradyrhizobium]MCK1432219.1 hypothetical protein [Bradyrhizobium sp. 87]MCK1589241.1 hypothetical protein [Bradyrhizobium sp. 169]